MDGREGMALPGSASYYLNRGGIGGSGGGSGLHGAGAGSGSGGMHNPSVFKTLSNPNIQIHHNVGVSGGGGGSGVSGSAFHMEGQGQGQGQNPAPNYGQGMSVAMVPGGGEQPVKKKRGRPRKYGPDGANMSLGLSPMSGSASASTPGSGTQAVSGEKANVRRGRPPGSGWKQKLAPLGEWMNNSAGLAFTPHVIHVGIGEDVAAKILAFAQQRPRALCILSANGSVSAVTLRQPTNSGGTVTYEGRFEILCLSGSYLLAETGGPRNRTGGISISVCSPDGHIIGGAIGGRLIAANPVQVVACSFVYGSTKTAKSKGETSPKDEKFVLENQPSAEKSSMTPPNSAGPSTHSLTPNSGSSVWPLSSSRPDVKPSQTDIDLTRG